jgi:WD40 repeat protein
MVEIDASKRPGNISEVQGELQRIKELLAGPGARIWQPPPSSSLLPNSNSQSWYIPSASQGAMQVQQQVQRTHTGSSRRTFLKRSLLAGTILALGGGGIATYLQHSGSALPLFGFNFGSQVQVINYDTKTALSEISWSPDGKHIALALEDYTVQIWDVSSGKQVFVYPGHKSIVYAVAWSPDGKHLASASMDKTVQVWEAGTGKRIFTYRGHSDGVTGVTWSPDGKRLASASIDKTVQVWRIGDRHAHLTYHGLYDSGTVPLQPWVIWSPAGKHIATGNYGATLEVWDANNGKPVFTYKGTPDVSVSDGIAWSPDGSTIAIGVQDMRAEMAPVEGAVWDEVQIWRVADGKRVLTLQGDVSPDSSSRSIAWSPDGTRIAVACYKGKVQVWDARSGLLIDIYTGQRGEVHAVAWSPDSQLIASVDYGGPIIIWRA